jgi:hypothetical protein
MISPEVAAQILAASSYYEGLDEGLGVDLEGEIDRIIASISNNPNLYPKEFGPVRRALIRRFKHIIFYTVRADVIVVVEFRDARQQPPDWEERGYKR